ncbi:hypothetical protein [Desulfolucanica intricata]|uniref:hypothetical protein n=1 Tax=Desulfolucanica intricata TaxID=1285191 RepID=UPI000AB77BB6|nr:hypothetical protein [Desulfolucanica intricata]
MSKVIVSISGGKDGTAALLEILDKYPKKDIIVITADCQDAEFDINRQYIDYL